MLGWGRGTSRWPWWLGGLGTNDELVRSTVVTNGLVALETLQPRPGVRCTSRAASPRSRTSAWWALAVGAISLCGAAGRGTHLAQEVLTRPFCGVKIHTLYLHTALAVAQHLICAAAGSRFGDPVNG